MSTRTLRCPSCDGSMREVDRRGLMIDICTECRGIFLDRGEMEKLLETVDRWEESQTAAYGQPAAPQGPGSPPTAPPPPPGTHPAPGPGTLPTAPPPPPGTHPGPGPGTLPTAPPPPGYPQQGPYGQPAGYGHGQPGHGSGLGGIADVLSAVVRESKSRKDHHYGYGHRGHKRHKKGGLGELFDDLLG
jgi:uncharacterized protein